ncbi:hypothetical protein E2562_034842 [Oryza meyeriana var. granulata]|uniref:Peroxidase n=1 Tax=Oryza meyeriana var. granulata TaxID=110450 RepID=A0A6G1E5K4_9ORYZ|nr:hypothetical protein E2562_034842 [Oryza meyeriana var. granulata]
MPRPNWLWKSAEGCFSVYIGARRQRFIIRTESVNHLLFQALLEEAFGYAAAEPLQLPCDAAVFVRVLEQGCDASVLISGASSERTAPQNFGLKVFEVIDDAKSQVEAVCPGVVSCADILALAARDAVDLRQKFADQGLTDRDLVTLAGAHTIGQTDCIFFRYRLYNFTATGNAYPTISPSALPQLRALCPPAGDGSRRVALDLGSPGAFDVSFFKNVRDGAAVLESDQRLWGDAATQAAVQNYAGNVRGLFGFRFSYEFPKAMVRMSSIAVKTGSQGEIRRRCSQFN